MMGDRDLKLSVVWVMFSILMFFGGWISQRHFMNRYVAEASPRFVAPHRPVNNVIAFHVGIECPQGYDMKFIAVTPKEEKESEAKPGEDLVDEVLREENRTNKLLDNAVCVKVEQTQKVK